MVMWRHYDWNTDINGEWYGLYFTTSKAVDFPIPFTEIPTIIVTPSSTNSLYWLGTTNVTKTGYYLTAYSPKKGMCNTKGDMLIVGKWKYFFGFHPRTYYKLF